MIGIGKNLFKSNVKVVGGASTDPDAQAFITAAGITDATQKSAVNQLVLDLKSANIWNKMKAIYPIVGGSASTHKWNLKNPLDTNAAYRLAFSTGWTHSSTGMKPNGTSAYSNTFLTPSTALTLNSTHLSYYSRTNVNTDVYTIGVYDIGNAGTLSLYANYSNLAYSNQYNGSNGRITASVTRGDGFFIGNRTANNNHNIWRNLTKLNTSTTSTSLGSLPAKTVLIAAIEDISVDGLKECAFASIGDGLTDAEASNLYTAVQNYQTTLGRNV
ncbi:MAG: hypothetical protein RIR01_2484 [Bacteroidota bacterium]|jgi:hypothetical protein